MSGIRVWLLRDSSGYAIYRGKQPQMVPDIEQFEGEHLVAYEDIDNRVFERVFGCKLKPGECKRVRITIEEC